MRLVGVAACLPLLLVAAGCGSGSSASDTPASVAQKWALDGLRDPGSVGSLQCKPGIDAQLDPIRLTAAAISGVDATATTETGPSTWRVTLTIEPSGATTFDVTVVKQGGSYLVCDQETAATAGATTGL